MKILCLSWRDIGHGSAGGAEVFTHEMLKRNTKKHTILHLSCASGNLKREEVIDGVKYVRKGNALSVIWHAWRLKNLWKPDLIVDQANTHVFLSVLWKGKTKTVLLIHQLTREIWFQGLAWWQWGLSFLGFFGESFWIWLYRNQMVLTVSESTKRGLMKWGVQEKNIEILSEGLDFAAWADDRVGEKYKEKDFTVLYAGRFNEYKGIFAAIRAVGIAQKSIPAIKLWILGRGNQKNTQKAYYLVKKLGLEGVVVFCGFVSEKEKKQRMNRAHVLVLPSGREGWGLVVTEAAAVGTTSIGYPSPGLTDSIKHNKTGLITAQKSPESLAKTIIDLQNAPLVRQTLQQNAHAWAKSFSWDNTGAEFGRFLVGKVVRPKIVPITVRSRTQKPLVHSRERYLGAERRI